MITFKRYSDNKGETIIYSDVSLVPEFYSLSINYEAVLNSLVNILTTVPGERLNHPDFGCNLEGILFELMSDDVAFGIYTVISSAITTWEPRIVLNQAKSKVTPDYDAQVYEVLLYFTVVGLNTEFKLRRYYKQRTSSKESLYGI